MEISNVEKESKMLVNLSNVIKALAQVRIDIDSVRTDNKDFIFLECAYICAKIQEELKGFIRVKLHEEI